MNEILYEIKFWSTLYVYVFILTLFCLTRHVQSFDVIFEVKKCILHVIQIRKLKWKENLNLTDPYFFFSMWPETHVFFLFLELSVVFCIFTTLSSVGCALIEKMIDIISV